MILFRCFVNLLAHYLDFKLKLLQELFEFYFCLFGNLHCVDALVKNNLKINKSDQDENFCIQFL